jgi:hypothetical protein
MQINMNPPKINESSLELPAANQPHYFKLSLNCVILYETKKHIEAPTKLIVEYTRNILINILPRHCFTKLLFYYKCATFNSQPANLLAAAIELKIRYVDTEKNTLFSPVMAKLIYTRVLLAMPSQGKTNAD